MRNNAGVRCLSSPVYNYRTNILMNLWIKWHRIRKKWLYRNDPKFSDRYAWANSADPDQRSSLIRVYAVCNSLYIFWKHYSKEKSSLSTFRVITTNVLCVWIFRKFTLICNLLRKTWHHYVTSLFSLPEQSSRRAIVLPPRSALALVFALASASTNVKVLR